MIDLRHKGLPNTVEVDGELFSIYTDFRVWLSYYTAVNKEQYYLDDVSFVFKGKIPNCDYSEALMEFFINANSTPHGTEESNDRLFDYIEDGEYIVASFMQVYGIDLTTAEMHWHLFKALFISLPENCIMGQIKNIRAYKKTNAKPETIMRRQKEAWKLPRHKKSKEEEERILAEIAEEFYNA